MSRTFTSKPISFINPVIAKLNLEDHRQAFGLVAASPKTDFRETVKTLAAHVPLPQLGGVTPGNPFDASGQPFGTLVAFLGKKGVKSAVIHSDPVTADNCDAVAADLHARCAEKLGEAPKFLLAFLPAAAPASALADALFRAAGGAPVFGCALTGPEAGAEGGEGAAETAVFSGGECFADRAAVVALGGDVRPVFAVGGGADLAASTNACLTALKEGMAAKVRDGVRFDMILAFSHEARFRARAREDFTEADTLEAELPEEIRKFGLFAALELCPVPGEDGQPRNACHGEAIVMCAF